MTEEGRPLCLSDSPKTATLMRRMVNRLGKSPSSFSCYSIRMSQLMPIALQEVT